MLTLDNSKSGEPLLLHDEPIYFDDKIVGRTTSGNFSFCFNKNISFGYVEFNELEKLKDKKVFIEVEKVKYPSKILSNSLNNKKIRDI